MTFLSFNVPHPAIRQLISMLGQRARAKFGWLLLLILFASLLEVLGVGMILPFIALLQEPERFRDIEGLSFMYEIYDEAGESTFVVVLAVAYLSIIILKNFSLASIAYYRNRFLYENRADLSKRLFRYYIHAPFELHLQVNSAEMLRNTTSTVGQFTNGLYQLLMILTETLCFFTIFALLCFASPYAVAVMAIFLGAFGIGFMAYLRPRTTKWGRQSEAESLEMIKWFKQSIDGVKEIRLLGREKFFDSYFTRHADTLAVHLRNHNTANELPRFFIEVLMIGGLCIALAVIAVSGEQLSEIIPLLGLFTVAGMRLMPSANRIITAYNGLKFSMPAIDILYQTLNDNSVSDQPDKLDFKPSFTKTIELENVQFTYENRSEASLVDINLSIHRSERIGITGHTGAGKTTLVDLIMGIHLPQHGRVKLDGRDVTGHPQAFRGIIGYVPQQVHLIDDTLTRNVALGREDHEIDAERINEVIRLANLDDLVEELPQGLLTVIGESGLRLSGGQRQRIGIARALYENPEILVLDEATSSLDYETERRISDSIDQLSGRKTIIVIAHRLSTVQASDRIVFVRDGRIDAVGSFAEVEAMSSDFRSLVRQMDQRPE